MLHASNFDSTIARSRVSKAFDKSRNIPAKYIVFLAANGVSDFAHKINQSVGNKVARTKTELMFK